MSHPNAWLISENAAGMIHQTQGLANAMGLTFEQISLSLPWPWSMLPNGLYPFPRLAVRNIHAIDPKHCPPILITCGKRSVYASLALKSQLGNKLTTIHIQNPNIDPKHFDYVVAPEHDHITGPNVYTTHYAINHITPALLCQAAADFPHRFDQQQRPLIMVVLGGSNRHFHFDASAISTMNHTINQVCSAMHANAIVLFSRRTPPAIKALCQSNFQDHPLVKIWDEKSANPYLALLHACDYVFLTCDSFSMISEALSAKKSTHVFRLTPKKRHSRLNNSIGNLITNQIIAPLQYPLLTCTPPQASETDQIAKKLRNAMSQ